MSVPMMPRSVLFPEPLAPSITIAAAGGSSSVTSTTARTAPKLLLMWESVTASEGTVSTVPFRSMLRLAA